jgi:hypothetical protein
MINHQRLSLRNDIKARDISMLNGTFLFSIALERNARVTRP